MTSQQKKRIYKMKKMQHQETHSSMKGIYYVNKK